MEKKITKKFPGKILKTVHNIDFGHQKPIFLRKYQKVYNQFGKKMENLNEGKLDNRHKYLNKRLNSILDVS